MREKCKGILCFEVFVIGVCSLVFFLTDSVIYKVFVNFRVQGYWMVIPVFLCLLFSFICKQMRRAYITSFQIATASLISLVLFFSFIKVNFIGRWVLLNFEGIAFVVISLVFIALSVLLYEKKSIKNEVQDFTNDKLFNLFYINTSKAHEIAMLIDNKIMKTIESEQVSEELLKRNTSFILGNKESIYSESGYSVEDSSKKRVYENFDVKTTKSIMLRRIYQAAKENKSQLGELNIGDLTIFENIELQQTNIDDTVMILNILRDSKIKNQSNNALEINLNKMVDKMLDDFTIDYTFTYGNTVVEEGTLNKYIIQLPYKSTDNFENGYQHNDLQLGKLSLIGIYRGEIDFSERDSISSKFLELMSNSYNQEIQQNEEVGKMKLSDIASTTANMPFEFCHKKLNDRLHLIDVIAVIQELNLKKYE